MSDRHPALEDEEAVLKQAARRWADERGLAAPGDGDVAALMLRVRRGAGARGRWRMRLAVVAVCVSLAVLIGGFALRSHAIDSPVLVVVAEGQSRSPGRVVGKEGLALASAQRPLIVEAGDDRIAMDRATQVHLRKVTRRSTRLALVSGRLVVHVKPRGDHSFEIDAGGRAIRVIGTRFSVNRPGPDVLEVAVANGVVQVDGPDGGRIRAGETWRLSAAGTARSALAVQGQKDIDALAFPTGPPAPAEAPVEAPPAPPPGEEAHGVHASPAAAPLPFAHWQSLAASGRYEDARRGLETYVAKHGREVEAWSLLADCRRKTGHASAVAAYRTVIALGDRSAKNRARFLAASFLQDQLHNHRAAVELLRGYLAAEPALQPLRGSAMVRLARALCATGRRVEAQGLLRKVMQELPQTTEASQASSIMADPSCR